MIFGCFMAQYKLESLWHDTKLSLNYNSVTAAIAIQQNGSRPAKETRTKVMKECVTGDRTWKHFDINSLELSKVCAL